MARWRFKWSIGVFTGASPLALTSPAGWSNPCLSAERVTDVRAGFVADPFLLHRDGRWHMFFEVWNVASSRGEIGLAVSQDCAEWHYQGIVLREPFHLSYPHVIDVDGTVYMMPETREAASIRLYVARAFPHDWSLVRVLLEGSYADPTLLHYDGKWWLFAQRGLDELRLFSSTQLWGDWVEHPNNPLWPGNRAYSRPGGRVIAYDGMLVRFAQDDVVTYGNGVRALQIDRLSDSAYAEHELPGSPVLWGSGQGWNATGMHHIDAQRVGDGTWIAAVDGASLSYF